MSYQVLARKYRPQQFDEVIAQEHVTRTLKNALKSGRISSGYLFTGPRGTGKTTTARILAKALNCAEGPTATPCDKCPSCKEIIASSSLDVLEIDAASNTGVDDIRTLRENVRYLPTSGKKRIYIIDEVHRLSGSAFDALLKTLEEPPPHVVFIFATTEPHKVPETIRSRTQRYDFHRVSVSDLSTHLKNIADSEKIEIDENALFTIARKADGSVRDGMSLLDQMSAFAGEKITVQSVIEALGLIERQFYFDYVAAIAAKDASSALDMVKKLVDSGIEIPEFCQGLADHFRHLLILQNSNNPEKLLELSESEMESFRNQVDYFTSGDVLRMIRIITDMTADLKSGIDPRLLLETNTLKLATMESTVLFEDILAHLADDEDIEEEPGSGSDLFGTTAAPKPTAVHPVSEPAMDAPPPEPTVGPSEVRAINMPMVQTAWPEYVDHLKRSNPMLSALLAMAEIKEVRDNIITAVFFNAGGTSKQVVEKPHYMSIISESLREYFKTNLKIKFEVDLNNKGKKEHKSPAQPEKIDTEKLLEEDDKLRNIVERFEGEIVGRKKADD
ncbi:MAG TPA: DNA polymerase III subunit gamma/tau [candidate division Zixibacteria bacterium]|nr:DNA polymerase III subunit gamma/tau [candidate division Zixibacteria bacterium]